MISALLRRRSLRAGVRQANTLPAGALQSARLRLLSITPAMLEAEHKGDSQALGVLLAADVPSSWPPPLWELPVWMHIAAELGAHPETAGWYRYMISSSPPRGLVGCLGAFPCARGDVELGYSVAQAEQGKGYASEAANLLTAWLLRRPAVRSVSAQAYQSSHASVRVMQHCGMVCVGPGDHPGTVRYRRWRA